MADINIRGEEDEGERARGVPLPLTPPSTGQSILVGGPLGLSPNESGEDDIVRLGEGASYLDFTGDVDQQLLGAGWRVSTQMRRAGDGLIRETRRLAFIETAAQNGTQRTAWGTALTPDDGHDLWISPSNHASFLGHTLNEQHNALREGRVQLDRMEMETQETRSRFESENVRMRQLRAETMEVERQLTRAQTSLKTVTLNVDKLSGMEGQLVKEHEWAAKLQSKDVRCSDLQEEVERLKLSRRSCLDMAKDKLSRANEAIRETESRLSHRQLEHDELARSNELLRKELSDRQSAHSVEVAQTIDAYEHQVERLREERGELLHQQEADETARRKDATQDRERRIERERQAQYDQNAQIKRSKEASLEAELHRLESEQRSASARSNRVDAENAKLIKDLTESCSKLRKTVEDGRKSDAERIRESVRREQEHKAGLKEAAAIAVAEAQSIRDEEMRKLRVERQQQSDQDEKSRSNYLADSQKEAAWLSGEARRRDLTPTEEARFRALVLELGEVKHKRQRLEINSMSERVDLLSKGLPNRSINGQNTASRSGRGSGEPLSEVVRQFDNSFDSSSTTVGDVQPPSYQDIRSPASNVGNGVGRNAGRLSSGSRRATASRTLTNFGVDAEVGGGTQGHALEQARRQSRLLVVPPSIEPARRRAEETPPFDGKTDWLTWYSYFCSDQSVNAWGAVVALSKLKSLLRYGPAADTLWAWEQYGDGTLQGLVDDVTDAMCSDQGDPLVKLERRRQGKTEGIKAFGLALKRLACTAYPGVDFSVDWLITKVNGLFIAGLYDPQLVADVTREWRTWMSLGQIMELATDLMRKRRLLPNLMSRTEPSGGVMGVSTSSHDDDDGQSLETADVAAFGGKSGSNRGGKTWKAGKVAKKEDDKPGTVVKVGDVLTVELLQKMLADLGETIVQTKTTRSGGPTATEARCWTCKKKGHFERNCPTLAESKKEKKSGN